MINRAGKLYTRMIMYLLRQSMIVHIFPTFQDQYLTVEYLIYRRMQQKSHRMYSIESTYYLYLPDHSTSLMTVYDKI